MKALLIKIALWPILTPVRLLNAGYKLLQNMLDGFVKWTCVRFLLKEDGSQKPWARFVPNLISATRGALLGPLVWLLHWLPWWVQIPIFVAAALTDLLDGMFARELDKRSRFGCVFDPFCDKLFYLWCVFSYWGNVSALVQQYLVYTLYVEAGVLVGQLSGLMLARLIGEELTRERLESGIVGKSKVFFECAAIVLAMVSQNQLAYWALVGAIVTGIGSFPEYFVKEMKRRKAKKK